MPTFIGKAPESRETSRDGTPSFRPYAVIPALGEASLRLPPAGTKFRREAKAGIHRADIATVVGWIPAFAGMTNK
jgi:hypothetical protein